MAKELERLDDQLKRSFEGEAWHGPSVMEALSDVTPELAHFRPVDGAHNIWELTLHLAGTYRLVLRRLAGEDAQLKPEEDWPPVPATPSAWPESIRALAELNRQLRDAVLRFDVARLDQPLCPGAPYTAYTQFIGVTQHDLYHAGQIAVLKKAARARAASARQITPILNVSDLAASFAWFEKLGWGKAWEWGEPPDFGAVRSGECEIFLALDCQGGRGEDGMWVAIGVEDVDALHRRCVEQGVQVDRPPADMPWSMREMRVRHPDGHVLRLGHGLEDED